MKKKAGFNRPPWLWIWMLFWRESPAEPYKWGGMAERKKDLLPTAKMVRKTFGRKTVWIGKYGPIS